MRIDWIRGNPDQHQISFDRPDTWFVMGASRGCGKSSCVEFIAKHYLERGHCILDLFGSKDGEGLAWLRSPYMKGRKVLVLHGQYVKVTVPRGIDAKPYTEFSLRDITYYDIIISAAPLYASMDEEYVAAAEITDKLYKRRSWRRLVAILVREASNLYYSRLMICKDQNIAKAQMVYFIREARHMGASLILDSLRLFSIDIDIRTLVDYLIVKAMGIDGLPKSLSWLYSKDFFDPNKIANMAPGEFILIDKKAGVGYSQFQQIPWHKQEYEDILQLTGIEVQYQDKSGESVIQAPSKNIGELEHAEIIRLYVREDQGMNKIATLISSRWNITRSTSTIWTHIQNHNAAIAGFGECPTCRRAKSDLSQTQAVKGGAEEQQASQVG